MTENHPITPSHELVQQWQKEPGVTGSFSMLPPVVMLTIPSTKLHHIATRAAQWAANQELEACCAELESIPSPLGIPFGKMAGNALRAARRPKPPTLKERIKQAISRCDSFIAINFSDDRIIIESSILDSTNRANLANDLRQVADALSPGAVGGFNG